MLTLLLAEAVKLKKSALYGIVMATVTLAPSLAGSTITVGTFNSASCIPFSCAAFAGGLSRYQQLYSSDAFSPFGGGAFDIAKINFTTWEGSAGGTFQPADFLIYLSTSAVPLHPFPYNVGPTAMDTQNPDANRGPDNAFFASFHVDASTPTSFITIQGTPFHYDPALGNLLLDVLISTTFLDEPADPRQLLLSDTNGALLNQLYVFKDNRRTSNVRGIVTTFETLPTTVPEPPQGVLIASALVLLLIAIRRQSHRQASVNRSRSI